MFGFRENLDDFKKSKKEWVNFGLFQFDYYDFTWLLDYKLDFSHPLFTVGQKYEKMDFHMYIVSGAKAAWPLKVNFSQKVA